MIMGAAVTWRTAALDPATVCNRASIVEPWTSRCVAAGRDSQPGKRPDDQLQRLLAALSAGAPPPRHAHRPLCRHLDRPHRGCRLDRAARGLADGARHRALGYAVALAAHRLVDGSRSLVTVNPVWGAVADFKMCWLALTGGLSADLARHPTIEDSDSRSWREYRTTRRDRWISAARRCC